MGLYSLSKCILIPSSVDAPNPHILYFSLLVCDGGGGEHHHGTRPQSVDEIYLSTAPNIVSNRQIAVIHPVLALHPKWMDIIFVIYTEVIC
jgi:hypothetical protein